MRRTSILMLLITGMAYCQPPVITAPDEIKAKVGRQAAVTVQTTGKSLVLVSSSDDVDAFREFTDPTIYRFRVIGYQPKTYVLTFVSTLNDIPSMKTVNLVVEGSIPPQPPGPGPIPPGPGPFPVDPAPIPDPGFRVLVVLESSDRMKLPAGQLASISSAEFDSYIREKCAKGPDGKTPERRIWDKDVGVSQESIIWQNAFKRPRSSLPWIVVSNGKTGYEGPLPATHSEIMALLKKYGG